MMLLPNTLILASHNSGKIQEMSKILASLEVTLISQSELNITEPEETGLTFIENAIIKARHAARYGNMPAIADDSGLEVDALKGQPGIYSARYGGADSNKEKNIAKLLAELKGIPESQRSARYQCVIVYMKHWQDPTPLIFQGTWEGYILNAPQGIGGFGYDPIFYLPEYQCSAAELSEEQKNYLSHRGKALRALISAFRQK
ncbi:RdgB/HAM1 family non-canonical purine NTP pyrophosphatase [Candidatus Nitrosacidococcus sp. I8]|uniref:RdgB/HAM1 family non-canonical purine NTP pyrophosphatase n=1 Tax=Candidatus Nitrosacidococcus sp. I8 TaxID=2942908 RepID=UPI0022273E37|nr:RdgB/HAM1 family non-canonical purine NTP pyrophosphatase [Candidatus Nitrosacidococcus sp. I8]CAH9019020.1 dITP/XTP pyrophosphatase [Candidatus Nitrosacidococcus sp. I8]